MRAMAGGALAAVVLAVSAVPFGTASAAEAGSLIAGAAPAASVVAAVSANPVWSKLTPANSPSLRDASLSAFDPATGQLVLVGGAAGGFFPGTLVVDNYTWTFDGASWSKHVTSVTPGAQDRLTRACARPGVGWSWLGQRHVDVERLAMDHATPRAGAVSVQELHGNGYRGR